MAFTCRSISLAPESAAGPPLLGKRSACPRAAAVSRDRDIAVDTSLRPSARDASFSVMPAHAMRWPLPVAAHPAHPRILHFAAAGNIYLHPILLTQSAHVQFPHTYSVFSLQSFTAWAGAEKDTNKFPHLQNLHLPACGRSVGAPRSSKYLHNVRSVASLPLRSWINPVPAGLFFTCQLALLPLLETGSSLLRAAAKIATSASALPIAGWHHHRLRPCRTMRQNPMRA